MTPNNNYSQYRHAIQALQILFAIVLQLCLHRSLSILSPRVSLEHNILTYRLLCADSTLVVFQCRFDFDSLVFRFHDIICSIACAYWNPYFSVILITLRRLRAFFSRLFRMVFFSYRMIISERSRLYGWQFWNMLEVRALTIVTVSRQSVLFIVGEF